MKESEGKVIITIDKELAEKAAAFLRDYASAIDTQPYRVGSYFDATLEREVSDVANSLEAATYLDEKTEEDA